MKRSFNNQKLLLDQEIVGPLKVQIFISHFVLRRQPAEFLFSEQNRQMNAGQYKIHSTNPVKMLQSPVRNS